VTSRGEGPRNCGRTRGWATLYFVIFRESEGTEPCVIDPDGYRIEAYCGRPA
jgi:hypothetical protein